MKAIRLLLYPFSLLYGLITATRNFFFDKVILKSSEFSIPIISVGNLSTGGTGKTPHIEYIARLITEQKTAVLSRGYGRKTKGFLLVQETSNASEVGDEPLQLKKKMKDITVVVDEKRARGINELLKLDPNINLILLDDAFQHRYVKPSVSILLTNFNAPFYTDHILPAGNLRESRNGYKRADIIIITSAPPTLSETDKSIIIKKINPTSSQKVFFSSIAYDLPFNVYKDNLTPPELNKELSVLLLTGIANPTGLQNYLTEKVKEVIPLRFNDHHSYTTEDIKSVVAAFRKIENPNKVIITTEKDSVRLNQTPLRETFGDTPVFYIPIKVYAHEEFIFISHLCTLLKINAVR